MKKIVLTLVLMAYLWIGLIVIPPSFALDVQPGQQVELRQLNRLGVPLHQDAQPSLKGRVPGGTLATVIRTDDAQHWLQIELPDGGQGWIVERYVSQVLDEPQNGGIAGEERPEPRGQRSLKLATWNIKHLRDSNGEGPVQRNDADFNQLKAIAANLNADIIALQEVENEAAARRVFDPATYNFWITAPPSSNRFPQMTGFAVRKDLDVQRHPEFDQLQLGNPNLRSGTDITVNANGQSLRLLAIHLKSACFTGDLDHPSGDDCETLADQVPILEQWIDRRANETVPFVILGDWNRRMNNADDLWVEIDDAQPANADLVRIPSQGAQQDCWNFEQYIDFFALDKRAAQFLRPNRFQGIRIEPDTNSPSTTKLSDHCPISIELAL